MTYRAIETSPGTGTRGACAVCICNEKILCLTNNATA